MSLIESLKKAIKSEQVPPIFTRSDMLAAKIDDPNYNLPNYKKKNNGSSNTNNKILVFREINGETYYSFDEQIFY